MFGMDFISPLLNMIENQKYNKYYFLFAILLLHIIAWIFLKPIWPFADDYGYAYNANILNTGNFHLTYDQFQNRFGINVPVAIIFKTFGITPYTISLWPLIASLITIIVVFLFIDKISNATTALIASFLIATNMLQIMYSISLYPDLIVSLYSISVPLVIYYGRKISRKLIYPVLLPILIALGFITKETILMIFPFIALVLIKDIINKEHLIFWKRTLPSALIILICFFTLYWHLSGDPFYKFKSLINFHNTGLPDETNKKRIFEMYGHITVFEWINNQLGYIFLFIFSLPSFVYLKKNKGTFEFYIACFALCLLVECILLFHIEKYETLFLLERMWMFLIAPLSILSAINIYKLEKTSLLLMLGAFVLLFPINFYLFGFNRGILFFLFLIGVSATFFIKDNFKKIILLLPFFILAVNFVYGNSNYRIAPLRSGNIIKEQLELLDHSDKKIILTEGDFMENHIIYNNFKEYEHLTFLPLTKLDSVALFTNVYCLVNAEEYKTPEFILQYPDRWNCVYNKNQLLLYKKKDQ